MHSSELEGGKKCDHLHPPDVAEVRKSIWVADEHRGKGKMTIFKIADTTPFLFEQNINDLSFGSHHRGRGGRGENCILGGRSLGEKRHETG